MQDSSPIVADAPRVEIRRSSRRKRTVTAYREHDAIVVLVPQQMGPAEERRVVDDLVRRVLAREARRAPVGDDDLGDRARRLAAEHLEPAVGRAVEPASVRWVTNQHRRWGSCTPSTGAIRLSHRLQSMPSWVIDYVLVHELTHLIEPDHSAGFWALVERYPQAQRARGYLEGYAAASGTPLDGTDDGDRPDDVD